MKKEEILNWLNQWGETMPTLAVVELLELMEGANKTTNLLIPNTFDWQSTSTFQLNK